MIPLLNRSQSFTTVNNRKQSITRSTPKPPSKLTKHTRRTPQRHPTHTSLTPDTPNKNQAHPTKNQAHPTHTSTTPNKNQAHPTKIKLSSTTSNKIQAQSKLPTYFVTGHLVSFLAGYLVSCVTACCFLLATIVIFSHNVFSHHGFFLNLQLFQSGRQSDYDRQYSIRHAVSQKNKQRTRTNPRTNNG